MPILRLTGVSAVLIAGGLLFLSGCEEDCITCLDATPPAVPTNVYSVTGDGRITVYWSYLEYVNERDLVAYLVYRREIIGGDDPFFLLGEVPVDQPFDSFTYRYVDHAVVNGLDYEYAVRSVDQAGNMSELSLETVIDTPRPEGYNLLLYDFQTEPSLSGFDFSALSVAGRTDPSLPGTPADILVLFESGIPYVQTARPQVSLQDYGTFLDGNEVRLDLVSWAPAAGYSQTGRAELIFGHAYIVEMLEPVSGELHYAKFAVTDINYVASTIVIDWAYQIVEGLPELKAKEMESIALDFEPIKF